MVGLSLGGGFCLGFVSVVFVVGSVGAGDGRVGTVDVVVNCRVFCCWRCRRRRLAGLMVL